MLSAYVMVDAAGGIRSHGTCDAADVSKHAPPAGCTLNAIPLVLAALLQEDPTAYWWDGVSLQPRISAAVALSTETILANGLSEALLTGVPEGAVLQVSGAVTAEGVVTTGSVTITSTIPGTLRLHLTCPPPHLPWRGVIHAT